MHTCIPRQAFENLRIIKELPGRRLGGKRPFQFRILFHGCIERDIQLIWNHLCDAIGVAIAPPHHSPDIAHDAFRFELAESNDLRDAAFAVLLPNVFEYLATARFAKINVDIGW